MILAAVIAGVSAGGTLFVLEPVSGNTSVPDHQQYEYKYIDGSYGTGSASPHILHYLEPELEAHIEKGWEPVGGPTIWTRKSWIKSGSWELVHSPRNDVDFAIQLMRRPIELAKKFKTVDEET